MNPIWLLLICPVSATVGAVLTDMLSGRENRYMGRKAARLYEKYGGGS